MSDQEMEAMFVRFVEKLTEEEKKELLEIIREKLEQ
jgi:hypothetical protein